MEKLFLVQRQHTAGAYITIRMALTHKEAVDCLSKIAAKVPSRPYNGEDKWQDSDNKHHVNRYRIILNTL